MEKRFNDSQIVIRSKGDSRYIIGYAAVFEKQSRLITDNGRVFYEVIKRGAFDELNFNAMDVILTLNHDKHKLLARTSSKTLMLSVDEKGLKYTATLPNTSLGNDTLEMLQRGDLRESSFIFGITASDAEWTTGIDYPVRYVKKIRSLQDVSIVTHAAYATTDVMVAARELNNSYIQDLQEMERIIKSYKS